MFRLAADAPSAGATKGDDVQGTIELQQGAFAAAGSDLPSLRFEATAWAPETTRVRITTPEANRWEVPARLFPNNLQPPQRTGA